MGGGPGRSVSDRETRCYSENRLLTRAAPIGATKWFTAAAQHHAVEDPVSAVILTL